MQTDRRKNFIKTIDSVNVLVSFWARAIIITVVLYVLGTKTQPAFYQILLIDIICLWWIIMPVVDYLGRIE